MKKRLLSMSLACALALGLLAGCGGNSGSSNNSGGTSSGNGGSSSNVEATTGGASALSSSWKVTCPWAPSGVAAMVSQKAATKSTAVFRHHHPGGRGHCRRRRHRQHLGHGHRGQ